MKFDPVSPSSQPALIYPPYVSTTYRGPQHSPVSIAAPPGVMKAVPVVEPRIGGACDLTAHGAGQPAGQRIVVTGRVRDEDGRPVPFATALVMSSVSTSAVRGETAWPSSVGVVVATTD